MFVSIKMYYKHLFLFFLFVYTTHYSAQAQSVADSSIQCTLLPDTHIVPLFTADSRAHRLSIQKPFDNRGYVGGMGGIFPLAAISTHKKTAQLSVASTLYTTLQRWTDHGIILNADFFVDLFLDIQLNNRFSIRTGAGHTSQHLSDDALGAGYVPINYVRDYYQAFGIYQLAKYRFMGYGGVVFNHNFKTTYDISKKFMFQLGFEHSPVKFKVNNYLYWAADVKFREEFDYGTTQNYQVGYKYGVATKHVFRFALNYSKGYEERGQFYTKKRELTTVGLFFDF